MVENLVRVGENALLQGDFEKAQWTLNAVLFLDPSWRPRLWQMGLCHYYTCHYDEGMQQFEADMDVNGGDLEEVLWHFICKSRKIGFENARNDGFLPLRCESISPPPMAEVLRLFQGVGTTDNVLAACTDSSGCVIESYNGTNALAYGHFYIGIYHELQGRNEEAESHLKRADGFGNPDYMGRLMKTHYELFMRSIGIRYLMLVVSIGKDKGTMVTSAIICGGWQLSTGHNMKRMSYTQTRGDIISQLLTLVDLGVSAFDFGDIYTGVETLFGSLLTAHRCRGGRRQDLTLHSKVVPDLDVIKKGGVDDSYIRGIVQRSLNRLKTKYIDLVQFHWWDTGYHGYIQAALSLKKLQDEGLVRHIALTNFDAHCTSELIEAGIPIASTQVQFSLFDHRPIESKLVKLCLEYEIPILAYGVIAGGFLTDKWIGQPKPIEFYNRSLVKYQLIVEEFGGWELYQKLLKVLRLIADRHSPFHVNMIGSRSLKVDHVTVAMVAIAYVLQQPGVGGVILGSLDTRYMEQSIMVSHLKLNETDLQEINSILKDKQGPKGAVYELEREKDGPHGQIMKYNLNQLHSSSHLEELCVRFIELIFSAYPVEATRTGYCHPLPETASSTKLHPSISLTDNILFSAEFYYLHAIRATSYDHFLNISSKNDIEEFVYKLNTMLHESQCINIDTLTIEQKIDLEIIISQLRLELIKWQEVRQYQKDPSVYLSFEAINYLLPTWGSEINHGSNLPDDQETTESVKVGTHTSSLSLDQLSHPGVIHLSLKHRLLALLSRLHLLPSSLKSGQENLVHPVRLFTERAIKLCSSFVHFFETGFLSLIQKLMSFADPKEIQVISGLVKEIVYASSIASLAINKFKDVLTKESLPMASNDIAIGRDVYNKLLTDGHLMPDSSVLLNLGEQHFAKVKKELEDLAFEIMPGKSWQEITEDIIRPFHPSAADLLTSYLTEISRAKDHMMKCGLVPSIPTGEKVIGFYTPQFLVPFSPFGDFLNPVPFAGMGKTDTGPNVNRNNHIGYLMLHSVADMPLSLHEKEKLLQAHDYTWISVIAAHECYPGHHVQALLAQQHPRVLRRYYESPFFYEGWGLYCEQLAYETGFFERDWSLCGRVEEKEKFAKGDKKIDLTLEKAKEKALLFEDADYSKLTRLTQLRLQLWRAARVILDIKLHHGIMTFEACQEFLRSEIMFNPHSTTGEVFMYASRPTYAPCYIVGLVCLMEFREKEKGNCQREGREFNLNTFHSFVLRTGCIPFPLLNKLSSELI